MEIITILLQQILIMFIFMFIGVILFKSGKMTLEGSKSLGNILIYVIMPSVVIKAYMTELTTERLQGLGICFILSFLSLLLAMLVSRLCFKKAPIENFGASFSNAGFLGIPLVSAIYGDEAVFYVSSFVALLNFLQWTYGVFVITEDKSKISVKKILTNPILISLVIGILIFTLQIPVGEVIKNSISSIASLNAPIAMFSLGTYLAKVSLKEIFTSRLAYLSSFVRLILIPILTMILLSFVPEQYEMMKFATLIVASTPIGSNVAIFAQIHNKDYKGAVKDVCLSTLCSLITLPLIIMLANLCW